MRQRSFGEIAANALIYVLGFCLLIVTAFQTIDLLTWILPQKESFLAYVGLAAFDVGFIFWSIYFRHGYHNEQQKAIALIMIVLDFGAIAMCTISNIILNAVNRNVIHLDTPWIIAVIFAVSIIIVINAGSAMSIHLAADHSTPATSPPVRWVQRTELPDTDELEAQQADPLWRRALGVRPKKKLPPLKVGLAAEAPITSTQSAPTSGEIQ